jgi:SAM-dependent methyltransferase
VASDPLRQTVGEHERIRAAYDRRATPKLADRYRPWDPANLFLVQRREAALLELLSKHGKLPVGDRRILDVGCGSGHVLNRFLVYGAKLGNLTGVDLLENRVIAGREVNPHLDIRVADASDLPFDDDTFDVVLAFTLFSSIKSPVMRMRVAEEVQRVLRPGGGLVWYDFWINPLNRDTESLGLRDIRRLFPGARVDARRATLAPPLVRSFIPHSRLFCELLEKVAPLRTHWLAWIVPRP